MAPAILDEFRIAYFAVPKSATTTIKHALYQLREGHALEGDPLSIHPVFRTYPLEASDMDRVTGYWTFTVVRDPVKRLLSGYGNRVVHHRDVVRDVRRNVQRARRKLVKAWLRRPFLPLVPKPDLFFQYLALYQGVSYSVFHHTRSIEAFVGTDLTRFDRVYTIEQLHELAADLSDLAGRKIVLGREQTGGPKLSFSDLDAVSRRAVLEATAHDYALLRDHYEPPRP